MAEEISVPPEVLETLLMIKRLFDAAGEQIQALAVAPGTSAIARPKTVQATAHIPAPVVATMAGTLPAATASIAGHVAEGMPAFPTVEQVSMTRAWIVGAKAAGTTAGLIGLPFALRDLAELILEVFP